MDPNHCSASNWTVYNTYGIAASYVGGEGLHNAESQILSRLGDRVVGKAILDIGVGGGRTARQLHSIASRYVGIDYAPEMIELCRERYPAFNFRCCDARRMDQFDSNVFDVASFSYNG